MPACLKFRRREGHADSVDPVCECMYFMAEHKGFQVKAPEECPPCADPDRYHSRGHMFAPATTTQADRNPIHEDNSSRFARRERILSLSAQITVHARNIPFRNAAHQHTHETGFATNHTHTNHVGWHQPHLDQPPLTALGADPESRLYNPHNDYHQHHGQGDGQGNHRYEYHHNHGNNPMTSGLHYQWDTDGQRSVTTCPPAPQMLGGPA